MSTLSDVQALYGGVRDTWAKSQAHVIAHVVFAGVVFVVCGATIPNVPVPRVDPKQISSNEWFQLAKDTGIIYASFVIPLVILAVYAALLRAGGNFLVVALLLVLPPSSRKNQYRIDTVSGLEPLALTIDKDDFYLGDLDAKSAEFVMKYQSHKNGHWERFQESITLLTKNSQIYLGDFLLFLVLWFLLFRFFAETSWVQANAASFWPVVYLLTALSLFAWFRVSRAMTVLPSMLRMYVSTMIRIDPDTKSLLEVSEDRRERVRGKLHDLLSKERSRGESHPSLLRYLQHRLGLHKRASADRGEEPKGGWPFQTLYEAGLQFSWNEDRHGRYDRQWLASYGAYQYYRLHRRLSTLAKSLWQFTRYIVTGVP